MVHEEQRSKSPFILLALLSVLVIATLVVASVYFMLPDVESQQQHYGENKHNGENKMARDPSRIVNHIQNKQALASQAASIAEPESGAQQTDVQQTDAQQSAVVDQQAETVTRQTADDQTEPNVAILPVANAPAVADANLVKTTLSATTASKQETKPRGRQEQANDCGIRFTENQLLVKNPPIE